MKKLEQIMQSLPQERQRKIEARTQELIVKEMTLRDIRKARELTHTKSALVNPLIPEGGERGVWDVWGETAQNYKEVLISGFGIKNGWHNYLKSFKTVFLDWKNAVRFSFLPFAVISRQWGKNWS